MWHLGYVIGSFNMRHFSGVGTHNINKIAEIIRNENFDIVAMQEVKRQMPIDLLKKRLPGWEGYHGKSMSDTDFGKGLDNEGGGLGFAFLWNTRRVIECSNDNQPEIITRFSKNITRKPFYGRFTPSGLGKSLFEIRLINIHLWYGDNKLIDIQKRLSEFELVTKKIYSDISNQIYGDNMPAYTVVLGDYNFTAVFCQSKEQDIAKYFVKTVQEKETTLPKSNDKRSFVNDYDHFSFDIKRFAATGIAYDRIDTVNNHLNGDFEKHRKEISDHVPIKIELTINSRR